MKSLYRSLHVCAALRSKTPQNLKGKKHSSQLWLQRQLRDPYVEKAKQENYRCRSAFKLLEINKRFQLLKPGQVVIDCGAAPGSWTQVAVKLTNADGKTEDAVGTVVAIDKQPLHQIPGATILSKMDFTTTVSQNELLKILKGDKVDVVLSDMAPNATGVRDLDHNNIIMLVYAAMKFALQVMRVDGTFVCKVWDGGKLQRVNEDLSRFFKSVRDVRPQATRDESTEKFILARGFKGVKSIAASTM